MSATATQHPSIFGPLAGGGYRFQSPAASPIREKDLRSLPDFLRTAPMGNDPEFQVNLLYTAAQESLCGHSAASRISLEEMCGSIILLRDAVSAYLAASKPMAFFKWLDEASWTWHEHSECISLAIEEIFRKVPAQALAASDGLYQDMIIALLAKTAQLAEKSGSPLLREFGGVLRWIFDEESNMLDAATGDRVVSREFVHKCMRALFMAEGSRD